MSNWYEIENIDAIPSPGLLLFVERIEQNLKKMVEMAGNGDRLRPHVKTHKLPQIVQMKLKAGIHKFKTATLVETDMVLQAGGRDVLFAYQGVGPTTKMFVELVRRHPEASISTIVDDPQAAAQLSQAATDAGVVATVYMDLNVGMNRSGIAPSDQALSLYCDLAKLPGLNIVGLHAYDGHIRNPDLHERRLEWLAVVKQVQDFSLRIEAAGLPTPVIVAGGSSTSWLWLEIPGVEVGAGTAALWDYGQILTCPESALEPAAVLVSRVISHPCRHRICLDLGHKAVAAEMPHPRVYWFGLEDSVPVLQSEEHLVLETPRAADFPVGSVLYGLPYHICPTVALYDSVWCIQNRQASERWPVAARGRFWA